jgi:hypothetical protein
MAAVTQALLDPTKARQYEKDEGLSSDRELIKELLSQLEAFKTDSRPDDHAPCDLVIVTGTVRAPLPKDVKETRIAFLRRHIKREDSLNDERINAIDRNERRVVSGQPGASLNIALEFSGNKKECEAKFEFTFLVFKQGNWRLCKKNIALESEASDKAWRLRSHSRD